jgi:hypothetical protein
MQPDKGGTATVRRAYREDIDWLRAAFRIAGLTTAGLLAGSTAGIVTSQAPSDANRAALQFESYNAFICFGGRCDLSGAAMPAHDRRGHSAGVGSCAPHRGGVGVCDGQVDADARA